MITTRTPLRVSFFGGGTDYPEYFERYPGAVIGTTINKYIYISSLQLEPIVGFDYRLSYKINEEVTTLDEIKHPVFRSLLKEFNIKPGWNFSVMSSLPSGSGLGSSSAFTVGLIRLLSEMQGTNLTRYDLARKAINIERVVLQENVGVQDQIHATFGSMNRYDFSGKDFKISPVRMSYEMREAINRSMYLVFIGGERRATQIVTEQVSATKEKKIDKELSSLYRMVDNCQELMERSDVSLALKQLGLYMDEAWQTKKKLSSVVSNSQVDEFYETAKSAGAMGGKLCGAGGSGFFLLLIDRDRLPEVARKISPLKLIPISMDDSGCTLITS
jgi:D-glycero-alpha-D-manno-heptose-7-phosphate kinase